MKTLVKQHPDCLREVTVSFTAEEVDREYGAAIGEIQKDAKFPGYRPGKVPQDIIEKNFAEDIGDHVFRHLLNQTVARLHQDGVVIYSEPHIRPMSNLVKGKNFSFALTFETAPRVIKGVDLKGLAVDFEEYTVDDSTVDASIENNLTTLESVGGKSEPGDTVTVKVSSTGEEKVLETLYVKPLVGHKKGEKINLPLAELGNYIADFIDSEGESIDVEVAEVERRKPQKPTDELVQQVSGAKSVAEYRENIRKSLDDAAKAMNDFAKRNALIDVIVAQVETELPKSLFLHDAQHEAERFLENNYNLTDMPLVQLLDDAELKKKHEDILHKTWKDIVFYLAVRDYADQNNIVPGKEAIDSVSASMAKRKEIRLDEFKQKATREEWDQVQERAKFETALESILSQVKFKSKVKKDLMSKK
jgi:trigger factor